VLGSSSNFDDGAVKFSPSTNHVVSECAKNRVSFREARAKAVDESANAQGFWYEEWMLECRAQNAARLANFKYYYISRAYSSNKVFLYKSSYNVENRKEWYLENQSIGVSVVVDECDGNDLAISSVRNR
jgi:hypothetical protein